MARWCARSSAGRSTARRRSRFRCSGCSRGDDDHIPQDQVTAFGEALSVEHEIEVYDGAPHSFFDRRAEQYADASADAWERVLSFIETQAQVKA